MDKIVALCKRRGFIFQSSEIYGGLASTYDYGHYGVLLKTNVKNEWWRAMLQERDDIVALDSAILQHPRVWEASGHLAGFSDPLVDCRACKQRFRADHVDPDEMCPAKANLPKTEDRRHDFTEARDFNLMFRTFVGPVEETASVAYLRPETAQGIFINFKNVLQFSRKKPPFGIAQIGKSFRNEITPGNFIFRQREFEQMELEYFVRPGTEEEWHRYWKDERWRWHLALGLREENLRWYETPADELAHYAKAGADIQYRYPFGWSEYEGVASRGEYDLRRHIEMSGESLSFFDEETREHIVPYVVEPAGGVDRTMLILLLDAYDEEETVDVNGKADTRVVLRIAPRLAPYKAAVLPLARKPELTSVAWELFERIQDETGALVDYDETGNIGKRYRRQDEIGTPFCITVDFDSLEDGAVTIRDRDTMAQQRVSMNEVAALLAEKIR